MTRVELVLESLEAGGAVVAPANIENQYIVSAVGELLLEPPVTLTIDPSALDELLEGMGPSALLFFPEVPAVEAARRLVSIDIEACLVSGKKALSITITPDDVEVVRSDEWRNPPFDLSGAQPGELVWTSMAPGAERKPVTVERLLREYADFGVRIESTDVEHEYVATGFRDREFEPQIRLTLDPEAFRQLAKNVGTTPRPSLPGMPLEEDGFRRISIDLDQYLIDPVELVSTIIVTPDGLQVTRPRR